MLVQRRDDAGQEIRADGRAGAEPDGAGQAVTRPGGEIHDALDFVGDAAGMVGDLPSGGGKGDTTAVALDELQAQHIFKILYLGAKRWLGDADPLRRLPEMTGFFDSQKALQLLQCQEWIGRQNQFSEVVFPINVYLLISSAIEKQLQLN
uniref:Uncharacterized protein n=1 Tax=Aquisalinus luteolus TaxID=1566827 RepID=A0A8J3A0N7_9PROT|nr:hypothetical protein GCM10011355_05100 [Aquisalinus luteolus]